MLHTFQKKCRFACTYRRCDAPDHAAHSIRTANTASKVFDFCLPLQGHAIWFLRDLRTPFGGAKQSGIGREGGHYSLEFYTELTNVCIKL